MNLAWVLLQFALCALIIARAGFVLCRSADALATAHGWGRGWVGLTLLATVTSLPELSSGLSAVLWVDSPNLAVGNALGACVANLVFLVVVDLLQRNQPMYREASTTHLLSAGFGIVMLGLVALSLLTERRGPAILHVGVYSPLLLGLYLLALRGVHAHERALVAAAAPGAAEGRGSDEASGARRRFALAALAVVGAGIWLPETADALAAEMRWSRSFVGTVFMAVATTLPEMAVAVSALRLRALDMALGNLLGSNLFNLTVLAVDDLAYVRGPLLADVQAAHAGTAVTALIMTGLVVVGLVMRPQGRVLRVTSWISIGLVAAYAINAALLYLGSAAGAP